MENQIPQQNQEIHEKTHHKIDGFKVFLAILAIVLVISNIVTVYFLLTKNTPDSNHNVIVNQNTNQEIINENINTNINDVPEDVVDNTPTKITVNWYPEAITSTLEELFGADKIALNEVESSYSILNEMNSVEKIADIKDGEYSTGVVYDLLINAMGINNTRFLKYKDTVFLLNPNIDNIRCENSYLIYLCTDKNISIANLETPDTLAIPDTDITLTKKSTTYEKFDPSIDAKELFEYAPGKYLYQLKNNGALKYFAIAEDQTIRLYQLVFDFLGEDADPVQYFGRTPQIFDITWSNGSKNEEAYLQDAMATWRSSHAYPDYITGLSDLKITGQTNDGDPIYELKDVNIKENSEDEQTIFEKMYSYIYAPQGEEKISFADFMTKHPIIFWQDPFGNFIEFKNAAYMPAAEFAKPVIYLYPENTTDVAVKVYPNNGLSITEPSYNDGWFVKASPNGNLYNYSDKQNYPYLFWEGYGLDYYIPKEGFVVAKDEVKNFLRDKLSSQGLLAKEYNEFIDFWAPKMEQKPYYFITFLPQAQFDQLAPLEINPQPDTIIRIFMDYKGLDEAVKVHPQIFNTPQRNGFTVVEWGGALHN